MPIDEDYLLVNSPLSPYYQAAQEQERQRPISKLCFCGGGAKGTVYEGVYKRLDKLGIMDHVDEVGGASAGAITAFLIGLGKTPEAFAKETSIDFTEFMDADKDSVWDPLRVYSTIKTAGRIFGARHGVYKGDKFTDWAQLKVAESLGKPNATFRDLHEAIVAEKAHCEKTGAKPRLKYMLFTGTNLSTPPSEREFSFEKTPDMPIATAVRISMSFPGAFRGIELENNAGEKDLYVDGGVTNNYPIEKLQAKGETLGFGLFSDQAKAQQTLFGTKTRGRQKNTKSLASFGGAIIDALASTGGKYYEYGLRTVPISVDVAGKPVDTLEFQLTEQQKKGLVSNGEKAAQRWFDDYYQQGFGLLDIRQYKSLDDKYRNQKKDAKEWEDWWHHLKDAYYYCQSKKGMQETLKLVEAEIEAFKKREPIPTTAIGPIEAMPKEAIERIVERLETTFSRKTEKPEEKSDAELEQTFMLIRKHYEQSLVFLAELIAAKALTETRCFETSLAILKHHQFIDKKSFDEINALLAGKAPQQEKGKQLLEEVLKQAITKTGLSDEVKADLKMAHEVFQATKSKISVEVFTNNLLKRQEALSKKIKSCHKIEEAVPLYQDLCKIDDEISSFVNEQNTFCMRVAKLLTYLIPQSLLPDKINRVTQAEKLQSQLGKMRKHMNQHAFDSLDSMSLNTQLNKHVGKFKTKLGRKRRFSWYRTTELDKKLKAIVAKSSTMRHAKSQTK